MRNIVFDFGNVLLKVGTFEDLIKSLDCIENPETFCKDYEELILNSHTDKSIDFFELIGEKSDKDKLSKQEMLDKSCEAVNKNLVNQIPSLSEKYNLYILSDIMRDFIPYFLKKYDIEKYFSGLVESCNVGYLKPSDEIYKYLLSEYNLDPKDTVFFDDRQKNIDGAEKNGIKGILFDNFDIDIEKKIESL